jgi:hypothetical protein
MLLVTVAPLKNASDIILWVGSFHEYFFCFVLVFVFLQEMENFETGTAFKFRAVGTHVAAISAQRVEIWSSPARGLPPGANSMVVNGVHYYQAGPTWYKPYYGSSGVYYEVVPAP